LNKSKPDLTPISPQRTEVKPQLKSTFLIMPL